MRREIKSIDRFSALTANFSILLVEMVSHDSVEGAESSTWSRLAGQESQIRRTGQWDMTRHLPHRRMEEVSRGLLPATRGVIAR